MADELYWIFGAALLLFVFYDFFYTTLSGSGAAILTRGVSLTAQGIIQFGVKIFGRKTYNLSAVLINCMMLAVWVILIWIGLYLVFSSSPSAITDEANIPASATERFYFIGYVISTLGIGDFKPSSGIFQILTSCFSFLGFIFFTTSITYLISISAAASHKRALALTINTLGHDPNLIAVCFSRMDKDLCAQHYLVLLEMINKNTVNHQSYPVLHFYTSPDPSTSLSNNFTKLHEAVQILLSKKEQHSDSLRLLNRALDQFLKHLEDSYRISKEGNKSIQDLTEILPSTYSVEQQDLNILSQEKRREILGGFLKSESYSWKDIFQDQERKHEEK